MAFNAYLLFKTSKKENGKPEISGESTSEPDKDSKNSGAIEIADYSFGVSMPVTTSRSDGGGATVGRANFDIFSCNKNIDTATCKLVEYCCVGKNIDRIVMHLYRSGAGADEREGSGTVKYAMVVFQNCVVTKVGVSGSGEELPKETLEFNYAVCQYWYQETDHDTGKEKGAPKQFAWSTVQNKVVADTGQKFDQFLPA